ncbi:MAG TPA: DUF2207 domain-containing protein [Gammaproteobacteria bacterium]|nr:DUF2207 domain-containing protein [Gammaproteobacteria bacterium]
MKITGMRGLATALLAVATLGGARGVQAAEEILHFSSHIAVAASGDITVTESITVNAEGKQIRRGIYRDLSTQYQDVEGNPIEVPVTVLSAERDGETVPYRIERRGPGEMRVYVGAADVLMEPGEYMFELVYRTRGQIRLVQGRDTLSWNTTGTWGFPIRKAESTIRLPAPVGEESLQTAAYTGTHDARRKEFTVEIPEPGVVRFETTAPLAAGEGLVVAVVFPADVVQ